jgi:hypothetical protein
MDADEIFVLSLWISEFNEAVGNPTRPSARVRPPLAGIFHGLG